MHQFNPSIIREYDIRGVYGKTLFSDDAFYLGKKYAALVGTGKKIGVGYDGRLSTPDLSSRLIEGLTSSGVNVVDLGIGPTPLTYFSVFQLGLDGCIMVTGSHNAKEHNGFKMMIGKQSLHGKAIKELAALTNYTEGNGKVEKVDLRNEYIKKITSNLKSEIRNLKLGWDPGNGAAGEIVETLAPKLTDNYSLLNTKIDGNFPAHHPDPSVAENLQELISLVKTKKLDVGFAFDGDADRVGIVDNLGRIIWGDQILTILARDVLTRHKGAKIIADIKSSRVFEHEVAKAGGEPILWKTGHSLIKDKMKETGALLGGEMSAHIFFSDEYFGYDDGIYAAIRFLNIMASTGKTSAELLDSLPQMFSSKEFRLDCKEEDKFRIIEEIKASLEGKKINDIDGVRVDEEHGWWLIRASNTGGHIVVRWEADSQENYRELEQRVAAMLSNHSISLN